MSEQPGQEPVVPPAIAEDAEVTTGSGERGTVMWIDDGEAMVVFNGGLTQVLPVSELTPVKGA